MRTKTRKMLLLVVLGAVVVVVGGGLIFGLPLACQSTGERRLVGTWEFEPPDPTENLPRAPQKAPTPTGNEARLQQFFKNFGKRLGQWAAMATPAMRVTFESDGTYSESMGFGGRRQVVTGQWEVVEGGDEQVIVRVYGQDGDRSNASELTISFEGDDIMLFPTVSGQPVRMRRRESR